MKKLILVASLLVFILSASIFLSLRNRAEAGPETTEQTAPDLAGQSFALSYYPINPDEPGVVGVAARFNSHNYRLTFSDSTYIQRSNRYLTEHPYRIAGDSIYLGRHPYHMDGLVLRDSLFIVELTPLR